MRKAWITFLFIGFGGGSFLFLGCYGKTDFPATPDKSREVVLPPTTSASEEEGMKVYTSPGDKTISPSPIEHDLNVESPKASFRNLPKTIISPKVRENLGSNSIDENLKTPSAVSAQEKMKNYPSPGEYVAFSLKLAKNLIVKVGVEKNYRTVYPEVYNLGGINKIHGLVHDWDNEDTILVGKYDPRRQPITLDDFVVALRARLVHGTWPVVSIDPTPGSSQTGMQTVRFEGEIQDTQFGADLLDADHRLKRMAIGHLPTGVPGLKSSFDFSMEQYRDNLKSDNKSQVISRFWFYPVLSSVSVRKDVVAMQGLQVGVFTEVLSAEIDGKKLENITEYKDPPNDWFAQAVSTQFEELSQMHPSFSRVQGLDELVALSKGIEQMDDLPDFGWWFEKYKVKSVATAKDVKVLKRKEDYTVQNSEGYIEVYREVSGGVRLMAIALRLTSGDVTALKQAVVATRPRPDALSWSFVVGEWIIPIAANRLNMKDIGSLFTQAMFLHKQDRYDEAITLYGKILELKPDLYPVFLNRGVAYKSKGENDQAIADYNQALAINPNLFMAYNNRGFIYSEKGQIDQAITDFEQAIIINPQFAQAYLNRGNAYAKKSQFDRALADYEQALAINPNAMTLTNRGNVHELQGQTAQALADYDQALGLNPQYAPAYSNRGWLYNEEEMYDKAITEFNQALRINPKFYQAYYNRGIANFEKGQYEVAIADFTHALTINPNFEKAYIKRGFVYLGTGKIEKALADYDQALTINPKLDEAYTKRAFLYLGTGKIEKALADYDQALTINPKSSEALNNRGLIYIRELGNSIKGCVDLRRACDFGKCENYNDEKRKGLCDVVGLSSQKNGDNETHISASDTGNPLIRLVQRLLKDEGFDPGPVDGRWRAQITSAVKEYQKKQGLPETGKVDERTRASLGIKLTIKD